MRPALRISRDRNSALLAVAILLVWPVSVWPQSVTATLPVTGAIAVNRVTNKIYVAGGIPPIITVVDGVSHATQAVKAGLGFPSAVAVDEATNKIYVAVVSD